MSLSDREWKVLGTLWEAEDGLTLGQAADALRPCTGWSRNTVHTYLTRMAAKGLESTEGRRRSAAVLTVSSQSRQSKSTYRPPSPAGSSNRSARTAQMPYCHRGESLSRKSRFTTSSSAATSEAVSVWQRKDQILTIEDLR